MIKLRDKRKGLEIKSKKPYALMNTNLTFDPWAKDPRTKPSFKTSKRYRDHLVFNDPANDKIQFFLPKDMDETLKRFPQCS